MSRRSRAYERLQSLLHFRKERQTTHKPPTTDSAFSSTALIFQIEPLEPRILLSGNPTVSSFQINDDIQRSMVTSISVQFSDDVSASLDTSDLTLRNIDTGQNIDPSNIALNYDNATDTATFTFSGFTGGSLGNGNYTATLSASGITDASALTLDGNGDDRGGDDYSFDFYRLFGDSEADRDMDNLDLIRFRQAFPKIDPDPQYNPIFDSEQDGDVDNLDLIRFRQTFPMVLAAPVSVTAALNTDTAPAGQINADGITSDPTITGRVAFHGEAAIVRASIDGSSLMDITAQLGLNGGFFFDRTDLEALFGSLADGSHTLNIVAEDVSGGVLASTDVPFTLDTTAPSLVSAPAGTLIQTSSFLNVVFSEPLTDTAFNVANYSLVVDGGPDDGQPITIESIESIGGTIAQINLSDELGDQGYRLTVTGVFEDLAGNTADIAPEPFDFTVADPVGITEISPANGEEMVNVTRETIVRFDGQVDPDTVNEDSFYLIANGQRLPGSIQVSSTERFATFFYDEPLPASTEVRVVVDGDLIMGRDGLSLDAVGDGFSGGSITADFRTLPLTRIAGTNVYGFVRDATTGEPIIGATIRVDAFPDASVVTVADDPSTPDINEAGRFELVDMPAPEFFVHVDGSTATNAPDGFTYPNVGKPFHSVPGQTVQLEMDREPFDIFLPRMAAGDIQPLSDTEQTQVGFGDAGKTELQTMFPEIDPATWDRMQVMFDPGTAVNDAGVPATQATIIPVPPDRLPAPLPPNLNPELVVSIQAFDETGSPVTNFDVPAPVTFPNLEGLAPREKTLIFSFDHDAGEWKVIGTGTVSADGASVESDPGVGILAPGWHFIISGSRNFNLAADNNGDKDYNTNPNHDLSDLLLAEAALLGPLAVSIIGNGFLSLAQSLGVPPGDYRLTSAHLFHFIGNSGTALRYQEGSHASELVKDDISHRNNHTRIVTLIKRELDARSAAGSSDTSIDLTLSSAEANVSFRTPDLLYSIGTTQGIKISGSAGIIGSDYVGELIYTYADTYGYGKDDANNNSWPDSHARKLQEAGWAQPFRVEVTVRMPFTIPANLPSPEVSAFSSSPLLTVSSNVAISTESGFGSDPKVYYRYELENGIAVTGTTNSRRVLDNVILPPNANYRAYFYSPSSNQWTSYNAVSGPSGSLTGIGFAGAEIFLENFGGIDSDADGIPDVGEISIGTNPDVADTDGDNINDAAEIEQGLDPLDNRGFPTGIVASLPLLGEARQVVVEGSTQNVNQQTAFVATGSHGLAIVDASDFDNPIVLGQLDLEGNATDVGVDSRLEIAAVAANAGGLHLVDVSDPMLPSLIQTIAVNGGQIEVVDGVAYVNNGSELRAYDLITGDRLQTLGLGGGNIAGIAREGSVLFTMDANRLLRAVDISGIQMAARGSVTMPQGVGQLFVGNGIAYIAAADTTQGGYATANVSDPDNLTLIRGSDAPVTSAPGSVIVTNGSGTGLLIGQSLRVSGDPSSVELVSTSDSDNNYDFLTRINLPSPPSGVAIGAGIAFVADGTAGLQVINYLPFDNQGVAPTVSINTEQLDVDGDVSGIQVEEGKRVPIFTAISDDVFPSGLRGQVRNVELLVNDEVVRNDLSFPWDLSLLTPAIAEGVDSVTVQVRATDTGGNTTTSDPVVLELVPDMTAPEIVAINPTDGSFQGSEEFRAVRISFSETMDESTLTTDNIRLVRVDDPSSPLTPIDFQIRNEGRSVQLTYDEFAAGEYELIVETTALSDAAGNFMETPPITNRFTVILGTLAGNFSGTIDRDMVWADTRAPYRITGNLTIADGVTLTILDGVRVDVLQNRNIAVDGSLVISDADRLRFFQDFRQNTGVTVSGVMTVTDTDFTQVSSHSDGSTFIDVLSGGQLTASGSVFNVERVSLADGVVLNAGDLVDNQFVAEVITPVSNIPLLEDNRSFGRVSIRGGSLTTDMTWRPMGTETTAGMNYRINGSFTVEDGVTLTVAPNTVLTLRSSQALTIDENATVNIQDDVRFDVLQNAAVVVNGSLVIDNADRLRFFQDFRQNTGVTVSGVMTVTDTDFTQVSSHSDGSTFIDVLSGGQLTASGSVFSVERVSLADGATGSALLSMFTKNLQLSSSMNVQIRLNDFTSGSVTASGDSTATIDLRENWWGTTDAGAIENKITHQSDDASRPTVDFSDFLLAPAIVPDLVAETLNIVSGTPLMPGGTLTLKYEVRNASPGVDVGSTAVVFFLSDDGTLNDPLFIGVAAVPSLMADSSTGLIMSTITLPDATNPWWISRVPGNVTLSMRVDALAQVIELDELNNLVGIDVALA